MIMTIKNPTKATSKDSPPGTRQSAAAGNDETYPPLDPRIAAGEFKAKCLGMIDEVAETGATYVITKRGKPMARLVPLAEQEPADLLGSVVFEGDLISPIGEPWDAEQ